MNTNMMPGMTDSMQETVPASIQDGMENMSKHDMSKMHNMP
jgi:hypothetical protein